MTLLTLLKIPEKRTVEQILRFTVETHLEYIFHGREQISQRNLFRGKFVLQNMDLWVHILGVQILCDSSSHVTPSTRNVELGVVRCPRSVASRWRSFTGSRCVILLSLQPGEDVGGVGDEWHHAGGYLGRGSLPNRCTRNCPEQWRHLSVVM